MTPSCASLPRGPTTARCCARSAAASSPATTSGRSAAVISSTNRLARVPRDRRISWHARGAARAAKEDAYVPGPEAGAGGRRSAGGRGGGGRGARRARPGLRPPRGGGAGRAPPQVRAHHDLRARGGRFPAERRQALRLARRARVLPLRDGLDRGHDDGDGRTAVGARARRLSRHQRGPELGRGRHARHLERHDQVRQVLRAARGLPRGHRGPFDDRHHRLRARLFGDLPRHRRGRLRLRARVCEDPELRAAGAALPPPVHPARPWRDGDRHPGRAGPAARGGAGEDAGRPPGDRARHAFGIPGGEVLAVMDALARAGIAFHLVKHETPGGFMADAVAHLTRTPGVLVATLGPGVSNLVTAVAHAYLDRTPMLVLTARIDPGVAPTYTHQIFDHGALLRPVTKPTFTVGRDGATALVDRAVLLATADPPGPVHLDIPVRVASMEVERSRESLPRRARVGLAPGGELDTLVGWLGRAERPLVLAGLGILHHDAHAELRAFVRRAGAAVITTYKAKGVVSEDDPAVIGGGGLSPVADRALFKALYIADLILCLGYDPVEMRDSWIQPWPTQTGSAEIAGAPKDHLVHRTKLEFVADLKAALAHLSVLVPERAGRTWLDGTPAAVRTEIADSLRPPGARWGPHAVIATCRRVFPRETLATVDTGAHRILLSHIWPCYEPYGLLQSTGLDRKSTRLNSSH